METALVDFVHADWVLGRDEAKKQAEKLAMAAIEKGGPEIKSRFDEIDSHPASFHLCELVFLSTGCCLLAVEPPVVTSSSLRGKSGWAFRQ